jgi:crotonobetainyl-CoA:carnitine CoA-transferase CaiB-like acyl-CoA transferase
VAKNQPDPPPSNLHCDDNKSLLLVDQPLKGLKVLDFSNVVAAPYAARLLSEMGASVLSVRDPNGVRAPLIDLYATIGKLSITLDLKSDRAQVNTLLAQADVVITNCPRGVAKLDVLGIGPACLPGQRRPFVHLNVTAYSPASSWAGRKGYAPMAAAATGLFYTACPEGFEAQAKAGKQTMWPLDGYPEDYFAGLLGVVGILAGLQRRAEHNQSFLVETSLESSCEWVSSFVQSQSVGSTTAEEFELFARRWQTEQLCRGVPLATFQSSFQVSGCKRIGPPFTHPFPRKFGRDQRAKLQADGWEVPWLDA